MNQLLQMIDFAACEACHDSPSIFDIHIIINVLFDTTLGLIQVICSGIIWFFCVNILDPYQYFHLKNLWIFISLHTHNPAVFAFVQHS